MRFLKSLVAILIIVGGVGFGIYHFGTNFISNKIADSVTDEMENSENVNEIKQMVNSNPDIQQYIAEGANVNESDLPFTTKEEAVKTIVNTIGLTEIQKMQSKYERGISQQEIWELINEIESKLTEEEILALKAIVYNEFNK